LSKIIKQENKMEISFGEKFYLSTDGYYFMYRHDKNDFSIVRASLYNLKNEKIDDVRVSAGYGISELSHTDLINHFEARLFLGIIK